jgi:DNA-binding MarR family transcriptional regulator
VPEAISDKPRRGAIKADALKADVIRQFRELSHHIENNHHPEEHLLAKGMQKDERFKNIQLTLTEFHIISCIGDNGRANQTQISKTLNLTNAGVYKNTLKLTEKQVIEALKLPTNKKEVYYRLTGLGEEIYKLHSEVHRVAEQDFFERLSNWTNRDLAAVSRFLLEFDMFDECRER